jgi:glycerol-3-phosphate acyltransferase PlsY
VKATADPKRLVAAGVLGYLLGTFPSAGVATRLAGAGGDLRDEGSGNPGALNAATVLGRRWGLAVLAADMGKGAAAGGLGRALAGDTGAYVAATASIGGHIAPVWSGFRGGKGVATSAGACLAVFPVYFPIDAAVAFATAAASQQAERSIQISSAAWTVAAVLWWRRSLPNGWGPAPSPALAGFAAVSSVMILAKFRAARRATR